MLRLIRSIEILTNEPLMPDKGRIFKQNDGYSVCLNETPVTDLYPLTKAGYDRALQRLLILVEEERAKYSNP